jgi:hypothetical protein
MLEAHNYGDLVFAISLKRSTQTLHPQVAGRLPHLMTRTGHHFCAAMKTRLKQKSFMI